MLRFMNDYEKEDRIRNMSVTLQFFLTIDIVITTVAYYVMDYYGMLETVDEYAYVGWTMTIALSLFPMAFMTARTFAIIRFVYRFAHMVTMIGIYMKYGHFPMPPFYMVYYSAELVYLHKGINTNQMEFPGKLMMAFIDRYHEAKEQEKETARLPRISVANEVIRKDCTIEDEFSDDLDYHTAYEDDDIFPTISSKSMGSSHII